MTGAAEPAAAEEKGETSTKLAPRARKPREAARKRDEELEQKADSAGTAAARVAADPATAALADAEDDGEEKDEGQARAPPPPRTLGVGPPPAVTTALAAYRARKVGGSAPVRRVSEGAFPALEQQFVCRAAAMACRGALQEGVELGVVVGSAVIAPDALKRRRAAVGNAVHDCAELILARRVAGAEEALTKVARPGGAGGEGDAAAQEHARETAMLVRAFDAWWRDASNPYDALAVEMEVHSGTFRYHGRIDALVWDRVRAELCVVDVKVKEDEGKQMRAPAAMQLAAYAHALKEAVQLDVRRAIVFQVHALVQRGEGARVVEKEVRDVPAAWDAFLARLALWEGGERAAQEARRR